MAFICALSGASPFRRRWSCAREPRLHFSLLNTVGAEGPSKVLPIEHAGRPGVIVSIYPNRDSQDEAYEITVELTDANGLAPDLRTPNKVTVD